MTAAPRIVQWYRVDPWPRLRRILLLGPCGVAAGGLVIAESFVTHQALDVRIAATVAGMLLVIGGVTFTMAGMYRVLRDDLFLTLRTDGLTLHAAGAETFVGWPELAGARWDEARGELWLERDGHPPLIVPRAFARARGPEVAAAIVQTKRRADMNLLR